MDDDDAEDNGCQLMTLPHMTRGSDELTKIE